MDLIKDYRDYKAKVNKSLGELPMKMLDEFADMHHEIGGMKSMVRLLKWQLGNMVTVITSFFRAKVEKAIDVKNAKNVETVKGTGNAGINDKQKSN
ncbi:hypothetical protein RUND412_009404 [Rhizina undulata]